MKPIVAEEADLPELKSNESKLLDFAFRKSWIFALFVLIMNLGQLFGLGNVNPLEKGLFLIAGVFFVLKNPVNKIVLTGLITILFSIFFFGALTEFSEHSWSRTISATIALFSILIFYVVRPSQEDRVFMLRSIALITPVMVGYGLVLILVFGRSMFMKDHTGAMRFGGSTIPAFMAAAAYSSAIASAMMFSYNKKIFYLILTFFSLFICILSGTRMPSVCAAVSALPILFYVIKNNLYRLGFVFAGSMAMGGFLLTYGDQILLRFSSSSSSGRDLLWDAVWRWVDIYPLSGVGFGHHMLLIPNYIFLTTGTHATHSEYIRLTAELGYIGAGLFIAGLITTCFFSSFRKNFTDVIIAFIITAAFFLYAYSDNAFLTTYCILGPLAYAIGSGIKPIPSKE